MDIRLTSRQVPRRTLPDADKHRFLWLVKTCRHLRLTYQISLLTAMAQQRGQVLIIIVPKGATISADLKRHLKQHKKHTKLKHGRAA